MLNITDTTRKRVVVVGGGFGGLSVIKKLRGEGFQIVLIDLNNYHQFQPLLYQVATSGLEPTAITFPLRSIFRFIPDFHFRMARVLSVDSVNSILQTSIGELKYDYLVLATGCDTNYFGLENIKQASLPLKSVGEALALRNHIYTALELAAKTEEKSQRERYLNFVIVGGGPTGVELAGAIAELKNSILPNDYRDIDFGNMNIILLNATNRLLEAFDIESSQRTLSDLQKMGVDVRLDSKVEDYVDGAVLYNGNERIITDNLIWVGGITANRIDGLQSCIGKGGRMKVDRQCKAEGFDNIYVVGDGAIMENVDDKFAAGHPQVAQVAIQQGALVGKNISLNCKGESGEIFKYFDKGSMATIGRNRAIAEINGLKVSGILAWLMWLFVHIMYIVGFRNRLLVLWDWSWSYITRDKPLRSIIESKNN